MTNLKTAPFVGDVFSTRKRGMLRVLESQVCETATRGSFYRVKTVSAIHPSATPVWLTYSHLEVMNDGTLVAVNL
jgi:hypothetical protein